MGAKGVVAGVGLGCLGGAVVAGAVGAACGAMSGAIGGAVLRAAGYAGYSALEAAQMGAAGTALIDGVLGTCGGGIIGGLAGWGMFSGQNKKEEEGKRKHINGGTGCGSVTSYVASVTLGGLAGWGMFSAAGATTMELGQTAAALAVGGAISCIPAGIGLLCVCVPLVLCGVAAVAAIESDKEAAPDMRPTMSPV